VSRQQTQEELRLTCAMPGYGRGADRVWERVPVDAMQRNADGLVQPGEMRGR
jgi:hypothetical protein